MQPKAPTIASRLLMLRAVPAYRSVSGLVVEGTSDMRLYGSLVDRHACHIDCADGRTGVVEAVCLLRRWNTLGTVGVVDADFDNLDSARAVEADVLRTDTHDLETTLIKSPAWTEVLSSYGLDADGHAALRRHVLSAAIPIGCLRLASQKHRWRADFKALDFEAFIEPIRPATCNERLVTELALRCSARVGTPALKAALNDLMGRGLEPWQVCCGHDMTRITAMHLTHRLRLDVHQREVEARLCNAYEAGFFRDTKLHGSLLRWEAANTPFRVLPGKEQTVPTPANGLPAPTSLT